MTHRTKDRLAMLFGKRRKAPLVRGGKAMKPWTPLQKRLAMLHIANATGK